MAKRSINKKGARANLAPKPTQTKKAPVNSPKQAPKTESGFQEKRALGWLIRGGALVTLALQVVLLLSTELTGVPEGEWCAIEYCTPSLLCRVDAVRRCLFSPKKWVATGHHDAQG